MIQRRTQTAAFWLEQFDFTDDDVSRLYDLLLEEGKPVPSATLVKEVMERRCRREEQTIRKELSSGEAYRPNGVYKVGDKLLFPALEFRLGEVVGTRPGTNPAYGDFVAIQVQMEGEDGLREFASALVGDHALNRSEGDDGLPVADDLLSVSELYDAYGDSMEERLFDALRMNDEFLFYRDEWFLRGLLAEVSAGHLNIAEALIEIKSRPLPTQELLGDLDLPAEIPEPIQVLSLGYALEGDERFDNVGDSGRDIWYLRRLAPDPVVNPPVRLRLVDEAYDRKVIDKELLVIEREIEDEGSGEEVLGPSRQIYRATLALTYPHWRCGTLPLTLRTRGLFPQATTHHTPVVLVDGQRGDKMQGWVVHEESFVYGLEDWYRRHRLPAGAYVKLARTRDPRVITIDYAPQSLKRLWIPIAAVHDGEIAVQTRKVPVACEYDEHLIIGEDDPAALDALLAKKDAQGTTLLEIMHDVFPDLAKLSPQGTVHAKTIYSAVNVWRRVPPGPVFALLSTEPQFVSMGGGFWTIDGASTE